MQERKGSKMKEEMKKILKMVEEKKITVAEAEKLMDALAPEAENPAGMTGIAAKFLRVRVMEGEETKVQVNLPISLVEIGLKIGMQVGPQFAPEMEGLKGIDFKELVEAIQQGARGKLVEVKDNNQTVEVYVD